MFGLILVQLQPIYALFKLKPSVTPFLPARRAGERSSPGPKSVITYGVNPFHVLLVDEIMPGSFAVLLRSRSVYSQPTTIYTVQLLRVAATVKLLLCSLIHSLSALCMCTRSLSLQLTHSHFTHTSCITLFTKELHHSCNTAQIMHDKKYISIYTYKLLTFACTLGFAASMVPLSMFTCTS